MYTLITILLVLIVLVFFYVNKQNRLKEESPLWIEEQRVKSELEHAKLNSDWQKKHNLNKQIAWIKLLKRDFQKKYFDPYQKLYKSDLLVPKVYNLEDPLHFDFCIEITAKIADFLSEDHEYKMCYYKPEAILPYSKKSFFQSANFLRKKLITDINSIKDHSGFEKIFKHDRKSDALKSLDRIVGMLFSVIPIEPENLPTDSIKNLEIGQQFEKTNKVSES